MKKYTSWILILLHILYTVDGFAASYTAADCSISAINTELAKCSSGDTVNVPAGDCSWEIGAASYITIPTGVKLIGAGRTPSGTNITITSYTQPAWNHYGLKLSGTNTLSGMSFDGNSTASNLVSIFGTVNRITNTKHEKFTGRSVIVHDVDVNNLIDNNQFYGTGVDVGIGSIQAQWSEATGLGSENFTFVENNRFSDISVATIQRPVELGYSHRLVFRYNDVYYEATGGDDHGCYSDAFVDVHGYCHASSAAGRAGRAFEVYNNKVFVTDAPGSVADAMYIRGGTGVFYKNYVYFTGAELYRGNVGAAIWNHRSNNSGSGDGQDSCYAVDRNPTGAHFCWGDAYTLGVSSSTFYYSGTLTGDTSGASATILGGTSTGSPLYFRTVTNGPFINGEGLKRNGVSIGTATTAQTAYAGEGYPCQDQPGSGLNQSTTREPIYAWGNVDRNGATLEVGESATTLNAPGYFTEGVDYFNSEKSGYSPYTCPHPLATDLAGTSCDSTLYGTTGYGVATTFTVTPSTSTGCTISPANAFTISSGSTTELTMTAAYGYSISGSGCSGSLSGSTFTTGAISADCTVTCTGQPHRAVLGGTGTVSLGGSGVACLSDLIALSYNGNESTSGTVPNTSRYCAGQTVTVLGNTGTLARTGYDFDGWNTAADGSGTSYSATDTFAISVATTLYAKWAVHVFSPSDISGLLAWYAADEIDGLNDGDPVGTWSDLSGNGHHFSQSTAGYKPLYKTNQVNGLPALHFDGNDGPTYNDDRMTTVDVVSPIRTVIVVARYYREASANFASYSGLITGTTADCWFIGNSGTDDWYTFESTGLTWYKDGSESNTEVTNAWHIFAATANSNRTFTVMLGYDRNNSGRTWGGEVAEIIIYNSVISGDNFTNIHNYLKTKYGTP